MKGIVHTRYGGPEVLQLADVPKPVPKADEVLVKVAAASLNPLDWHYLRGEPWLLRLLDGALLKPKVQVLGADFSGRVEAVGENVTQFRPGDEVFGASRGSFAEFVGGREDRVARKPATLSFEEAAAVPIAALSALQALRDNGRLQPEQKVLINGAGGGVGTFAVQIAKALGAVVTAVCSAGKIDLVRSLGADHIIDYANEDVSRSDRRFDVIVDNAAFRSPGHLRRVLTPAGRYVLVGGSMVRFLEVAARAPWVALTSGQKMSALMAKLNATDLAFLGDLHTAGKMKVVIGRRYSFAEVPAAIAHLEEGHAVGKIVITFPSGNS